MEKKVRSEQFLRKRKMLLVLPLLVLPFVTIGFYALGGGGRNNQQVKKDQEGLNVQLPTAAVKVDENANKLSFYEKAAALQKEREKQIQNDPYFRLADSGLGDETVVESDPEGKIYEKISLLEKEINRPPSPQRDLRAYDTRPAYSKQFEGNVDRLEQMMGLMKEKNEDDPELRQLDTMLEKIMDVQHPDRVRERLTEKLMSREEKVFTVGRLGAEDVRRTGFYGLQADQPQDESKAGEIEAVVHETQSLVNNSVIRLRLVNDVTVNGSIIPKDNFVYGITSLSGERLSVQVSSIRNQNLLYPVKMEVYDMDGLPGIYVPGAITREAAKQSADNSLQFMDMGAMDPSLKAQVAAAGIDAAKNLLSRKVKLVRVSVKAGYRVLLANTNH